MNISLETDSDSSPLGLLVRYRQLLLFYALALFFDTVSTIHFMNRGGIHLEIHPLVRWGALIYGPIAGPFLFAFLFKFLSGLLVLFYVRRLAPCILRLAAAVSTIAGILNFWGESLLMR